MVTDKKHIAVYLDPAVEQALVTFCQQRGLISKKGFMYSAGVNAALAAFFGIADIDNILQSSSNTPNLAASNTPNSVTSNIPTENIDVEVLPGKPESGNSAELPKVDDEVAERLQKELSNLNVENEKLRADYDTLLESSTVVTKKLEQEVQNLRSQIETLKGENESLRNAQPVANFELLEAPDLLNKLKAKRKKATASFADIEAILEILEELTPMGGLGIMPP
jgi:hypothetical protein